MAGEKKRKERKEREEGNGGGRARLDLLWRHTVLHLEALCVQRSQRNAEGALGEARCEQTTVRASCVAAMHPIM